MKPFNVACLCVAAFFLTGCTKKITKPQPAPAKKITQVRTTRHFSGVEFDGNLDVVIKRSRKGSSLSLNGDSRDLAFIESKVKDGKVTVEIPDHFLRHGPVKATVYVNKLNYFAYNGNGDITGKNINTSNAIMLLYVNGKADFSGYLDLKDLKITGKNTVNMKNVHSKELNIAMNHGSKVVMQGVVNLRTLRFGGEGSLALHWVDSPDLTIEGSGRAKVYLGGIARFLRANTREYAELDVRYLRANKVYVKAHEGSLIRVVSNKELNAYATGQANIYYYQSPRLRAEHMAQSGAVLNFIPYR